MSYNQGAEMHRLGSADRRTAQKDETIVSSESRDHYDPSAASTQILETSPDGSSDA